MSVGWFAYGNSEIPPAPSGEQFEIAHRDQRAAIVEVGRG
jgi:hypothetical protein